MIRVRRGQREGPGCWRHQETWGCAGLQGLRERWGLGAGPVGFCPASPQQRGRNSAPAAHFGTSPELLDISLFLPFSGMESGDGKTFRKECAFIREEVKDKHKSAFCAVLKTKQAKKNQERCMCTKERNKV